MTSFCSSSLNRVSTVLCIGSVRRTERYGNYSWQLQHGRCFKSMSMFASKRRWHCYKIKLSVEYLYIIIYRNRVVVFVSSFPKPTARLKRKKGNKLSCTLIRHSAFLPWVNVRVLGKARFLAYMVWGYSFLFGNTRTYVRLRKWLKIHKYQSQNRKIYVIKILNKKEKVLKKAQTPIQRCFTFEFPRKPFRDRTQSFVIRMNAWIACHLANRC